MEYVLIHELQPYEDDYKIRVRVCRIWRGKRIKLERNDGLHCVLVDEKVTLTNFQITTEKK